MKVYFISILCCFYCISCYSFTSFNLYQPDSASVFQTDTTQTLQSSSKKKKRKILREIKEEVDSITGESTYYGVASFYSQNLEGTKTSTEETFKHSKMTCASNRFKLNTWLRITNTSNGKSIIARVNDRMHPRMDAKGRIVDLTYTGAKKLGFVAKGVTNVKVVVVTKGTKF